MARIGIVQISDTQFGPKHVFDDKDFSRKIVADVMHTVHKHTFVPVFLICSGDIAESGMKDQFDRGLVAIQQIADGLSISYANVLFCPGNHDVNWSLSEVAESVGDARLKLNCYDKFCEQFYGDSRNRDDDSYQLVLDHRYGICFAMLNSCETENHENHVGHVSKEKLLKTMEKAEFLESCQQGYLNIAVVHHLLENSENEEGSTIENAVEIKAILDSHNFQVAMTGHVHAEFNYSKSSGGKQLVLLGCGSTGVNQSQRADGVPNQYSIHVIDNQQPAPRIESYLRAYNPRRPTSLGMGGWTKDSTYDHLPLTYDINNWDPRRQTTVNYLIEDQKLASALKIRKNPFTVSNAEKFPDDLVLKLFVHDEERHRAALRLSGDAIIRGRRGSGKTMCLRYLDAIGSNSFRKSLLERKRAECFPVSVNLGHLHVSETAGDINRIYEAAENLIVEQTLSALDRAVELNNSPELKSAVHRTKQRFSITADGSTSKIARLGGAITEHLSSYFDHVLLLIDEIASKFPKVFFRDPETGFGKWMNSIRNSGPFNTRIAVYPNDVSDTLNEERFGTIVNLEFDPAVEGDMVSYRKYATDLFERYTLSVSLDTGNSPKMNDLLDDKPRDPEDAFEQLLFATDGSSRRLMRFFEKCLTFRCRSTDRGPLEKSEVWELISEYSESLLGSYIASEQQLALSIAKGCKAQGTYRFKCSGLSEGIKRLSVQREETNIISIIELGSGSKGTSYEFNFPFCVQMGIPTHHLQGTNRLCKGRDSSTGEWIRKITNLKRETLDIFKDEERLSGEVSEFIDDCIVVRSGDEDFIAYEVEIDLNTGDRVSFIAVDDIAEDLLLV